MGNNSTPAPHACGRAKVIERNGPLWTLKCPGCGKRRTVNIGTPEGKEWLVTTGRAKRLEVEEGGD